MGTGKMHHYTLGVEDEDGWQAVVAMLGEYRGRGTTFGETFYTSSTRPDSWILLRDDDAVFIDAMGCTTSVSTEVPAERNELVARMITSRIFFNKEFDAHIEVAECMPLTRDDPRQVVRVFVMVCSPKELDADVVQRLRLQPGALRVINAQDNDAPYRTKWPRAVLEAVDAYNQELVDADTSSGTSAAKRALADVQISDNQAILDMQALFTLREELAATTDYGPQFGKIMGEIFFCMGRKSYDSDAVFFNVQSEIGEMMRQHE